MFSVFIVAEENEAIRELRSELTQSGLACTMASNGREIIEQVAGQANVVLVEMDNHYRLQELSRRIKREVHLPIFALLRRDMLDSIGGHSDIDDFIFKPYDLRELVSRVKRLLHRTNNTDSDELTRCGDLVIDWAKCEVSIGSRLAILTFREYELLKFLTSNRGRVFTREALLNRVWGYDYYGGDRTVDVHIRRLRSKIEDSSHTFIETVRNIGYKFREKV